MKYFLVEGNIIDAGRMTDDIMKEHMAYTGAAMERGMTFMSGLYERQPVRYEGRGGRLLKIYLFLYLVAMVLRLCYNYNCIYAKILKKGELRV